MTAVTLALLPPSGMRWAQRQVERHHYLHAAVPTITRPQGYGVHLAGQDERAGCLIVNRPQATRRRGWYGTLADVATGVAPVSYWQVLCLARVWLDPRVQGEGAREQGPGYYDRRGVWRSTIASTALRALAEQVRLDYLLAHPPVFADEPFEMRWLMSYCDTRVHRGTIYAAAGWERFGVNEAGIETWRTPLAPLTNAERRLVLDVARSRGHGAELRATREQARLQAAMSL